MFCRKSVFVTGHESQWRGDPTGDMDKVERPKHEGTAVAVGSDGMYNAQLEQLNCTTVQEIDITVIIRHILQLKTQKLERLCQDQ